MNFVANFKLSKISTCQKGVGSRLLFVVEARGSVVFCSCVFDVWVFMVESVACLWSSYLVLITAVDLRNNCCLVSVLE